MQDMSRVQAVWGHVNVSWTQLPSGHWVRYFSGVNSYVRSTSAGLLATRYGTGSFIAWVQVQTWQANFDGIFCDNDGAAANWVNNRVNIGRSNVDFTFNLSIADGVGAMQLNGPKTSLINLLRWYCIGYDWNGTTAVAYTNGVQTDSQPQTVTDPNLGVGIMQATFGKTTPTVGPFQGWIGDIRQMTSPIGLDGHNRYFESTRRLYGV
jgi:hypothetical protein